MPERLIASTDSRADDADAGLTGGNVHAAIDAPAVAAHCDDSRVLRVKFVSGRSNYRDFISGMTTP